VTKPDGYALPVGKMLAHLLLVEVAAVPLPYGATAELLKVGALAARSGATTDVADAPAVT